MNSIYEIIETTAGRELTDSETNKLNVLSNVVKSLTPPPPQQPTPTPTMTYNEGDKGTAQPTAFTPMQRDKLRWYSNCTQAEPLSQFWNTYMNATSKLDRRDIVMDLWSDIREDMPWALHEQPHEDFITMFQKLAFAPNIHTMQPHTGFGPVAFILFDKTEQARQLELTVALQGATSVTTADIQKLARQPGLVDTGYFTVLQALTFWTKAWGRVWGTTCQFYLQLHANLQTFRNNRTYATSKDFEATTGPALLTFYTLEAQQFFTQKFSTTAFQEGNFPEVNLHDIKTDIRLGRTLEDMAIHESIKNKRPEHKKPTHGPKQTHHEQYNQQKTPATGPNRQTGPTVTLANYPPNLKKALEAAEKSVGAYIATRILLKASNLNPSDLAKENICTATDCRTILIRGQCNCLRATHPKPSTAAMEKFAQLITPGLNKAKSQGPAFLNEFKRR